MVPGAGGVADLVGELGDEVRAGAQVWAPLRVGVEDVGGVGQPAQRPSGACGAGWGGQAPVEHGGGVVGVAERGLGGVVQRVEGVVSFYGQQGQVAAQHRPCSCVGDVCAECCGGGVDARHEGGAGVLFGGARQGVRVHGGGAVQAGEGVGVGGGDTVGGLLGAVAGQDGGEDIDGSGRVRGFGGQDAVGVGLGGGAVEVVFGAPAGCGDVELLAGEPVGNDGVAGAFGVADTGGHALGGVDGACVAQGGVGGDVAGGKPHRGGAAA